MLEIDKLLVSQESIDHEKVQSMKEHLESGGIWNVERLLSYSENQSLTRHGHDGLLSPLIAITRFEDGTLMVQNGHHRVRATREFRDFLHEEEYIISDWQTHEYLQVNFERTYVTPYDPRTHIRLLDFGDYKRKVLELAAIDQEAAMEYIKTHTDDYCKERIVHKVMDMEIKAYSRKEIE